MYLRLISIIYHDMMSKVLKQNYVSGTQVKHAKDLNGIILAIQNCQVCTRLYLIVLEGLHVGHY